MTAAQLAIIAGQKPPSMHDGGAIQQFGAPSPQRDEVNVQALEGEFMMNKRATAGNREQLEEMNRTGSASSSGGGTTVDDVGRALAGFITRELGGDGELGRSTRTLPSARTAFR